MKRLLVAIVLFYLRVAARIQLAKIKPIIIGVAGSSGKSSLVSLIAGMLSEKFSIKQSLGKNSETGLPLDILDIHMRDFSISAWIVALIRIPVKLLIHWKKYDVYVAEMGIDSPAEPKNMSYLLRFIQPTVGVVSNVTLEHSEYFEPYVDEIDPDKKEEKILELTAREETMLLTRLDGEEKAIINLDDTYIRKSQKDITSKKITISIDTDADVRGKDIDISLEKFSMILEYQKKNYPLTINRPLPRHFAYECLLALGVGLAMDMEITSAVESLEKNFSLPAGRLSIFQGIQDTILIDSTYNNATLPPVIDILNLVHDIAGKRRKIAILGDMRELGQEAEGVHEAVAKEIIKTVDMAICIGPLSEQFIVPVLKKANFSFENFPDVTSAMKAIPHLIQKEDIILVKGSQNTLFLERIVEKLLLDKKDIEKLTRRGAFWDKKRSESL